MVKNLAGRLKELGVAAWLGVFSGQYLGRGFLAGRVEDQRVGRLPVCGFEIFK